jgi:hypothetical protein
VEIVHTNIPDEDFDNMKEGWEDVYISSLEDFFSEEES